MPLRKVPGSEKAFKYNVRELIRSWRKKGKIGKRAIKTFEEARRTALAIAFRIKRGGKDRPKRGGK